MNEFSGLELIADPLTNGVVAGAVYPGEKVLQRMGLKHSLKHTLMAQVGIILVNYLFTCGVLMWQNPKGRTIDLTKKTSISEIEAGRISKNEKSSGQTTVYSKGLPSVHRL